MQCPRTTHFHWEQGVLFLFFFGVEISFQWMAEFLALRVPDRNHLKNVPASSSWHAVLTPSSALQPLDLRSLQRTHCHTIITQLVRQRGPTTEKIKLACTCRLFVSGGFMQVYRVSVAIYQHISIPPASHLHTCQLSEWGLGIVNEWPTTWYVSFFY